MPKRTKAVVTFEDSGKAGVTSTLETFEGDGFDPEKDMSFAVVAAIGARALFRVGLLVPVGIAVTRALANEDDPDAAVLAYVSRLGEVARDTSTDEGRIDSSP